MENSRKWEIGNNLRMEWGKEDKIRPSYLTPTTCGLTGGLVEEGNCSSVLVFHQRAVRRERGGGDCAVGIHLAVLHLKDGSLQKRWNTFANHLTGRNEAFCGVANSCSTRALALSCILNIDFLHDPVRARALQETTVRSVWRCC